MGNDLVSRLHEIIKTNQYVNIASVCSDGRPWNTPVYARADSDLRLYWTSWIGAQHSINLRQNGLAFVTIYDSTRVRGDNNRRCLYMEGAVVELNKAEEVYPLLGLLYGEESRQMLVDDYIDAGIKRIYKFSFEKIWLNSVSEREVSAQTTTMRIEVPING